MSALQENALRIAQHPVSRAVARCIAACVVVAMREALRESLTRPGVPEVQSSASTGHTPQDSTRACQRT